MGVCAALLAGPTCGTLAMLRIVFVITDQKFSTRQFVAWVILLLVAAGLLFACGRIERTLLRRGAYVFLSIFVVVLLVRVVMLVEGFLPFARNKAELDSAVGQYENEDYTVLEGTVSSYQISLDRTQACFYVDKTQLCSDVSATPVGYHRNASAFQIEDGMRVKVFYHNPLILRIDLID